MTNNLIVHISDLKKAFSGSVVLDGITMELHEGENLVILGQSGTGKSVIMKCIVKLMEADEGQINVFGTEMTNCSAKELSSVRSRIGYLFQEGALYDSMNVRENLLFPVLRNKESRKKSIKELTELAEFHLENVGLIEAIDMMPAELSGGMKKRAGLARTLMLSPELIIYDEPTTGLDPYRTEAISDLIVQIQEKYNTSSLIITHDIKCAKITGNRLTVLHDGKLIANGSFESLSGDKQPEVQLFFK